MVRKKRDRETNEKLLAVDKIILLQIKQTKCVCCHGLYVFNLSIVATGELHV